MLAIAAATRAHFEGPTPKPGCTGTYVHCFGSDPAPTEPEAIVQEALHFACLHGHVAVAAFLIEQCGADVNGVQEGHHCGLPLLQSLFLGFTQIQMTAFLVSKGADPTLTDPNRNQTALEFAAGNADVEALLLGKAPPPVDAKI